MDETLPLHESSELAPISDPAATSKSSAPRSLEGLHGTVPLPPLWAGFWRQYRAFVGPAFLVSVGYMDPGNWATDLKGGAEYRYGLLWVVAVSSFMAVIMQILSARLGVVTGKDLAQACRDYYPRWSRLPNWIACEIAIAACDLAEVIGSAVAITLLFPNIPLLWAVCLTACDVLLLLALQGLGMRFIEAIVVILVATIGGCYFIEIFVLPHTQPDFLAMGHALITPSLRDDSMIVGAIGIIGATVMPHNLYLHSALVHSRRLEKDDASIRRAIRFNTIDTVAALSVAFLVNAAILVLAAMVFYGKDAVQLPGGAVADYDAETKVYTDPDTGKVIARYDDEARAAVDPESGDEIPESRLATFNKDPDWIRVAYLTLAPLLGTALASVLFAVALLASGQSSTITGTLAGQVVMEGFLRWRIRPWVRRLITRLVAIVPAIVLIALRGEHASVNELLVLSQVVLGLQLPLAMFPLLQFTSSHHKMGRFRNGWFLLATGWTSCVLIFALDLYGLPGSIRSVLDLFRGH